MNTRWGGTTVARMTIPSLLRATTPMGVVIPKVWIDRAFSSAPNGPGRGRRPIRRSRCPANSRTAPDDQFGDSSVTGNWSRATPYSRTAI